MSHTDMRPMSETDRRAEPALVSIQYLRALAALMVVAYHIKVRIGPMGYHGGWPEWLSCGVDIFFVISGFIMWTTTCRRPIGAWEFLKRRLLRIVPLYWLVSGVVVAASLVAPSLVGSGRFDPLHAVASFLFVAHPSPTTGRWEPVVPQGWTLNYEMEFYVLFAAWLLAPLAVRRVTIPLSLVAIALAGTFLPRDTAASFYASSLILEFGFGVLVAVLLEKRPRLPPATGSGPLPIGLLLLGLAGLVATWPLVERGVPRVWLSGVSAAAIVAGAVLLEARRPIGDHRLLRLLGDASYSIYLAHGLALSAFAYAWTRTFGVSTTSIALFVPAGCLAATIAGVLLHLVAERPLLTLGRRWTRSHRPLAISDREGFPGAHTPLGEAAGSHTSA